MSSAGKGCEAAGAADAAARARKAKEYLRKHQLREPPLWEPVGGELGLTVVIPCRDEPDPISTLESLWRCSRPCRDVEVLLVANTSRADPPELLARHRRSIDEAGRWMAQHGDAGLRFYLLDYPDLPERHAGVGLARKLGMDAALARLACSRSGSGIIVSLDADCLCARNYLTAIEDHFESNPQSPAASVYFEHRLDSRPELRAGIVQYELFLRYYIHALRYARYPHAFHTVGSAMAVRSESYAAQGGMNRRQAGEDFYFLHKLIPLGGFGEIRGTTVYPSARASLRMPFGTARALAVWAREGGGEYRAYAPEIFRELRALMLQLPRRLTRESPAEALLQGLPDSLVGFLQREGIRAALAEMQANVASEGALHRRFLRWLTALRVLRYVHWASERYHPRISVGAAARQLLAWLGLEPAVSTTDSIETEVLLKCYRRLDRGETLRILDD